MYQGIRPLVTTGVALVGASVIAVSPLTVPPPDVQAPRPVAQRVVEMSDVQLASVATEFRNFIEASIAAPGNTADYLEHLVDGLPSKFDHLRTLPPDEAAAELAVLFLIAPNEVVGRLLAPLIVNVPGDHWEEYDFVDAAASSIHSLAMRPLDVVTVPAAFIYLVASGQASPAQAAALLANGLLKAPFNFAQPWIAALANALPPALGGGINPADGLASGAVYRSFLLGALDYEDVVDAVFPPNLTHAKTGAVGTAVVDDPWPPSAKTTREVLEGTARLLTVDLPKYLANVAVSDVRQIAGYLELGRPLDAIRLLASHSISLTTELVGIPVGLGATFLPPPVGGIPTPTDHDGGLLYGAFSRGAKFTSQIANEIAPDPIKIPIAHKQITPSGANAPQGNPGSFVNLSLPGAKTNVDEFTNVGVNKGTDPVTGNQVSKLDNNKPKIGSNARAVVKEIRKDIRQTVKDVRQGIRNVVKDTLKAVGIKTPPKEKPADNAE